MAQSDTGSLSDQKRSSRVHGARPNEIYLFKESANDRSKHYHQMAKKKRQHFYRMLKITEKHHKKKRIVPKSVIKNNK